MKKVEKFPAVDGNPFNNDEGKKVATEKARLQAETGYKKLLADVQDLADMTKQTAWIKFSSELDALCEDAKTRLLNVEKTRDIITCQERIKIIQSIFNTLKHPVFALNDYVKSMPLFTDEFTKKALFDDDTNTIEIVDR